MTKQFGEWLGQDSVRGEQSWHSDFFLNEKDKIEICLINEKGRRLLLGINGVELLKVHLHASWRVLKIKEI